MVQTMSGAMVSLTRPYKLATALLVCLSLSACLKANTDSTNADIVGTADGTRLSIIGDPQVVLEPRFTVDLLVRYEVAGTAQGSEDTVRVGEVTFDIEGDSGSAFGDEGQHGQRVSVQTSAGGDAKAVLYGSPTIGESFEVVVSAPGAQSVRYNVTIGYPELGGTHRLDTALYIDKPVPGFWGGLIQTFGRIAESPVGWLFYDIMGIQTNGSFILNIVFSVIESALNSLVQPLIPEAINDAGRVSNTFIEAIKSLHVETVFEVVRDEQDEADDDPIVEEARPYLGNHSFVAMHTEVGGEEIRIEADAIEALSSEDYGRDVTLIYDFEGNRLEIAEHTIPVPYGAILNQAMSVAIRQETGRNVASIGELLRSYIDCRLFAEGLVKGDDFGSQIAQGALKAVCEAGLGLVDSQLKRVMGHSQIVSVLKVDGRTRKGQLKRGGFWRGEIEHGGTVIEIGGSGAAGHASFESISATQADAAANPAADDTDSALSNLTGAPLLPSNGFINPIPN